MYKLLKKPKFINIIAFILMLTFTINLYGCSTVDDNGVAPSGVKNQKLGIGRNIDGYTVYSEATFNAMTEDVFMGYLLGGKNFTLVVVPATGVVEEDDELIYSYSDENKLLSSAEYGVYKYDESLANFVDYDQKVLLYYVTDLELLSWFNSFKKDDSFMKNALQFTKATTDIAAPSRYTCENLVNLGSGVNATTFCGTYGQYGDIYSDSEYRGGIISSRKWDGYDSTDTYSHITTVSTTHTIFKDENTGGMILFFGDCSIEGYMTYEDIDSYTGSEVANNLENCSSSFSLDTIQPFDYKEALGTANNRSTIYTLLSKSVSSGGEYGYTVGFLNEFYESTDKNNAKYEELKGDIISIATEQELFGKTGCERLKSSYKMIAAALRDDYRTDYTQTAPKISEIKTLALKDKKSTDTKIKEKGEAIYDIIEYLEGFDSMAKEEAFSIKFSVALFNRYNKVTNFSASSAISSGNNVTSLTELNDSNAVSYVRGNADDSEYLVLVTADGFLLDRGTESDQIYMGASDMLGFSEVLQEMIRMDSCPNETVAGQMYNKLANLKIAAGIAIAVSGAVLAAAAVIGLVVCQVIAKLAAVSLATPVPGGRIVALVLAVIAGLIAIGVGIYTLVKGLKEKARLKGMGASETNYCKTYMATFNFLFESLSLPINVYHYEIKEETDASLNSDLSINYCTNKNGNEYQYLPKVNKNYCIRYTDSGKYEDESGKKYELGNRVVIIPLYKYANRDMSAKLNLEGCPALLYYKNGKLVDAIYGASTPEFIVEMLRIWGLLSFREMVYQTNVNKEGTTLSVSHTSNTNARTMKINSLQYCFNEKYGADLFSAKEECFASSSKTEVPINKSIDDIKTVLSKSTSDLTNQLKGIVETSTYLEYIKKYAAYKFIQLQREYKFTMLNQTFTGTYSINKQSITYFDDQNQSKTLNYDKLIEYNNQRYIIINNYNGKGAIFKALNDSTDNITTLMATFEGTWEEIETKFNEAKITLDDTLFFSYYDYDPDSENEILLTIVDFFNYVAGSVTIASSLNETRTIYFTTTVKETPQASFYYTDAEHKKKKSCDAGEYLYYRDNLIWGDNAHKCVKDEKVKKKDTALSTETANLNIPDAEKYNYYSTSIEFATVTILFDFENGQVLTDIEYKYDNKN